MFVDWLDKGWGGGIRDVCRLAGQGLGHCLLLFVTPIRHPENSAPGGLWSIFLIK